MTLQHFTLIFLGGGLGSVARYLLGVALPARTFPLGTLLANLIGCLLIGYLAQTLARDNAALRALCITGFCGGFTTFSTFTNDLFLLGRNQQWEVALLYGTVSFIGGILCLGLGYKLTSL